MERRKPKILPARLAVNTQLLFLKSVLDSLSNRDFNDRLALSAMPFKVSCFRPFFPFDCYAFFFW